MPDNGGNLETLSHPINTNSSNIKKSGVKNRIIALSWLRIKFRCGIA